MDSVYAHIASKRKQWAEEAREKRSNVGRAEDGGIDSDEAEEEEPILHFIQTNSTNARRQPSDKVIFNEAEARVLRAWEDTGVNVAWTKDEEGGEETTCEISLEDPPEGREMRDIDALMRVDSAHSICILCREVLAAYCQYWEREREVSEVMLAPPNFGHYSSWRV